MGCHETIMARRSKKKSKAAAAAAAAAKAQKDTSPMMTDKSLPALPPTISTSGADGRPEFESDTPTELSPRPRNANRPTADSSSRGSSRPGLSPDRGDEQPGKPDGLTLPSTTYRRNRNSAILGGTDINASDSSDGRRLTSSHNPNGSTPSSVTEGRKDGDYFSSGPRRGGGSRGGTPHIAFQEKDRSNSSDQVPQTRPKRPQSKTEKDKTRQSADAAEDFKLQEAPRSKKGLSSRSDGSQVSASHDASAGKETNGLPYRERSTARAPRDEEDTGNSADAGSKPGAPKQIARKELPASAARPIPGRGDPDPYSHPRSAPAPPRSRSSTVNKDDEAGSPKPSPKLPRWSSGADFSMDEDMARILGTDEGSTSIMRRVSNAVRHGRTNSVESASQHHPHRASHGRSISETTRSLVSPRWPKSMSDEGNDMASPLAAKAQEDAVILKRQLRNSEQRVAELERQFNTEKDLQNLNKKLLEKRKTVSALDSQTEIMIKQLETLAGYVERAKETKAPINPSDLEDSAVKEFVQKLEHVKEQMTTEIEELHEQRDRVMEEREKAMADRDRALMEFEQLSSKNAQLADMNNDLTHQIQERFKSQVGDSRSPNGLGIYGNLKGNGSNLNLDATSMTTGATLVPGDDDAIVESGPTVVQVRKGQVKKFNWKKGSKTMAQNVAKGVNRAVVAFQQNERPQIQHQGLSGDNIGIPYNMTQTQTEGIVSTPGAGVNGAAGRNQLEPGRQGFGFFGKKSTLPKSMSANTVTTPMAAEPPSVLFGSDLSERAEFEHRQIPSVVTRCIEEVELRGMDQEGIYRKTGGNSQVNAIKDGFDKNENFDISDPDLDITAVTSVLKQYFRKLPTPLLTFDIYERVLESNGKLTPSGTFTFRQA